MIEETQENTIDVARPLAPEEIRPDDYLAVMAVTVESLPCVWGIEEPYGTPAPVRTVWTPCDAGTPLRVVAVCLPFVLVEGVDGKHSTLDVRRHRVARLAERYARKAFKRLRRTPTGASEG